MIWAKEPIPERPGCYRLLRRRGDYRTEAWRQVGILCLDHATVRFAAEAMAQDVILVLNTPEMVDEWLAMRAAAEGRMRLPEAQ